jgi:hypothetical protein
MLVANMSGYSIGILASMQEMEAIAFSCKYAREWKLGLVEARFSKVRMISL